MRVEFDLRASLNADAPDSPIEQYVRFRLVIVVASTNLFLLDLMASNTSPRVWQTSVSIVRGVINLYWQKQLLETAECTQWLQIASG